MISHDPFCFSIVDAECLSESEFVPNGTVLIRALALDSDPSFGTVFAKAKALASLGESGRPGMASLPGCTTTDTFFVRPYASAIALQLTDVDPETRSEARRQG